MTHPAPGWPPTTTTVGPGPAVDTDAMIVRYIATGGRGNGAQPVAERGLDYQWADLRLRRAAVGISGVEMARLSGVKQPNYSGMETGKRRVPAGLIRDTLARVESAVAELTDRLGDVGPDDGTVVVLTTYDTDTAFSAAHPDYDWLPVTAHHTAVGRAASLLEHRGRTVRIDVKAE